MRPITASADVPQAREAVYDFLDLLANHEQFTDHLMRNWRLEGPGRGVGAKAKLEAVLAGRSEPIEIEVIEATAPITSVERNVGAGGRRVATGTYTLDTLPNGGTRITFTYVWQRLPLSERLAAPVIRRLMTRALNTAMHRLAQQLQARDPTISSAGDDGAGSPIPSDRAA